MTLLFTPDHMEAKPSIIGIEVESLNAMFLFLLTNSHLSV